MSFYQAQLQPYSLSGAGAVAGATSIVLKSFKTIDGTDLTMADFGSVGYGTLEPGNGTLEEQISFTGIVQNSNGTATLTGVKHVLFLTPYTETSGLDQTHAGSTPFVISNTAGFYSQFPAKDNDETITGQWTFDVTPITPPAVSNASATVKGITKLSVNPTSATEPIAVGDNDTRVPQNAYATDTGTANTYVITLTPAPAAYAAGQIFSFKAANANTGSSTLNVNSLGALTIKDSAGNNLVGGRIIAGQIVDVAYDGTNLQMVNTTTLAGFGDGSDGDVTISSPTTLTRNMYYDNLVVNDTLTTDGYLIFVKGTISGSGTITWGTAAAGSNAASATGAAAGAASGNGLFRNAPGGAGGNGSNPGANGANATTQNSSAGVAGGAGGNAGSGAGGSATQPTGGTTAIGSPNFKVGILRSLTLAGMDFTTAASVVKYAASSGGGGGGGSSYGSGSGSPTSGGGGGGGASGGIVFIAARVWAGTFTIAAPGGNGGNGFAAGGTWTNGINGAGGGGGGGGGTTIVVYALKTWTGSYSIAGGTGGTGGAGVAPGGTGSTGATGTAGVSYEIPYLNML